MIPQQTPDWPCFHFSYFIRPSGARKIDQCSGNRRMSSLVLSVLFASVCRESWESGEESGNFVFSQLQSLWCLARFAKLNCTFALCVAIPWRSTEQFSFGPIGCLATLNVPVKQTQSFHTHCAVSSIPHSAVGWSLTCLVVQRERWREAVAVLHPSAWTLLRCVSPWVPVSTPGEASKEVAEVGENRS